MVRGDARAACHPAPRPGVLLDRDGTIIVDHGHVGTVDRVELIDGRRRGDRQAQPGQGASSGSNQPGWRRPGVLRHQRCRGRAPTHRQLLAELGAHIDRYFYCPYHPEGTVAEFTRTSVDRKPMPGMARAAAEELNLDLTSSWVVGDRPEDIGLAEAVGASAIYVGPDSLPSPRRAFIPQPLPGDLLHPRTDSDVTTTYGPTARPQAPPFPAVQYGTAASYAGAYLDELTQAAATIDPRSLDRATEVLLEAYTQGRVVFSCGNGGSAAVANHLQCDHLKGVRSGTDLQSRVISLSSSIELLTAIANDVGYHDTFAYQLRAQSHPRDVLIVISSSGKSPNILRALQWACDNDLRTIALTGFDGGRCPVDGRHCHPRRKRELRDRGRPPSVHHARHGPVHPTDPDERGHDRVEHLLMAARTSTPAPSRPVPSRPNSRGDHTRLRVAINLLTEDPRNPSGAHWFWTRMVPEMANRLLPGEELHLMLSPAAAARSPRLWRRRSLHHLPLVERASRPSNGE